MTQRVNHNQSAPSNARFAPDVFDSQVGHTVPLRIEGSTDAEAVLVDAEVSEDGTSVTLTLDVPDGTVPGPTPGSLSLSVE
jgi:hypothetical protein